MVLLERLNEDIKVSLKSGDASRAALLRYLLAQVRNREIEIRSKETARALTDEEVIEVFQKEIKKRKESIELFRKGGRTDLVEKEEKELSYIMEYVPPPLSKAEMEKTIDEVISHGASEFTAVMKETMKRLKGKADGRIVGELIKNRIQK